MKTPASQLNNQLWNQLMGQFRDQIWGQLRDQLWAQLAVPLKPTKRKVGE